MAIFVVLSNLNLQAPSSANSANTSPPSPFLKNILEEPSIIKSPVPVSLIKLLLPSWKICKSSPAPNLAFWLSPKSRCEPRTALPLPEFVVEVPVISTPELVVTNLTELSCLSSTAPFSLNLA